MSADAARKSACATSNPLRIHGFAAKSVVTPAARVP